VSGTDEFEVGSFGNGDVMQITLGVDEVVRKVEGFHIAQGLIHEEGFHV
jgi:hypothetical protein